MTDAQPEVRSLAVEPGPPRSVGLVWALLLLNTLGTSGVATIIPFNKTVGQLITMGALCLALGVAIALNPRLQIRPNAYLLLMTLLLLISVLPVFRLEAGAGAAFRCFRLALFIAAAWLLSRWWRGDLSFARYHVKVLSVVLFSVVLGLVVAPGLAQPADFGGRLVGTLWPLTAPQVGQYAAVAAGLTILLWLTRKVDNRSAALIVPMAITVLLLSHTRTATIALVAALAGASLTLMLWSARSRRIVGVTVLVAGLLLVAFWPAMKTWFARDQDPELLSSLTGRTKVWDRLLTEDRTLYHELFGIGLTDKSFGGLPIDNSWLTVYMEQGLIGVAIVVAIFAVLLGAAALRPPSAARACAVFLTLYCAIASYSEVGLGDASPYLLHLAVAASLLAQGESTASAPAASARAAAP